MLKFLHGVNTGGLEKLGELRAYTLDAEKVGMVDPCENKLAVDAGSLLELFTTLGSLAFLKKLVNSLNAGGDKLFSVNRTDALNVDNFVSHCNEN